MDVIKGFECCIINKNCEGCPYACCEADCFDTMLSEAFELIKSQQSELDELHACIQYQIDKAYGGVDDE